ncbi:MAG: hypothetical protein BWZ08_02564 [candidate division BRC1 bacterium ADurb.BinA292]|nr:MAG: hypothetical protein BWZ08_02564 [candidate division BRC1 bacterium ADurb.BinA292]
MAARPVRRGNRSDPRVRSADAALAAARRGNRGGADPRPRLRRTQARLAARRPRARLAVRPPPRKLAGRARRAVPARPAPAPLRRDRHPPLGRYPAHPARRPGQLLRRAQSDPRPVAPVPDGGPGSADEFSIARPDRSRLRHRGGGGQPAGRGGPRRSPPDLPRPGFRIGHLAIPELPWLDPRAPAQGPLGRHRLRQQRPGDAAGRAAARERDQRAAARRRPAGPGVAALGRRPLPRRAADGGRSARGLPLAPGRDLHRHRPRDLRPLQAPPRLSQGGRPRQGNQ